MKHEANNHALCICFWPLVEWQILLDRQVSLKNVVIELEGKMKNTVFLIFVCILFSLETAAEPPKPNIVIIFTDDQGYADLGVYGSADLRTPNIDQIAQRGARLLNFYAQPSCGPSRAALLTGSYPILVGEPSNKKNPNTILHEKELTIAEMLQKVFGAF